MLYSSGCLEQLKEVAGGGLVAADPEHTLRHKPI